MAGHSKWANTKHRKAAQDSKRAKIFTKIIRELTVAAKAGAEDIQVNEDESINVTTAFESQCKRSDDCR